MLLVNMLQAPYIKRWGIVGVDREQNIAEHSFKVALIAEELYAQMLGDEYPIDPQVVRELYELAIWHDMAEVETGDINSKFKDKLNISKRDEYNICPRYEYAVNSQTHSWQEPIVKLADTIEALSYITCHGFDNKRKQEVIRYLNDKLEIQISEYDVAFPQFEWGKAVDGVMEAIGVEDNHGNA